MAVVGRVFTIIFLVNEPLIPLLLLPFTSSVVLWLCKEIISDWRT